MSGGPNNTPIATWFAVALAGIGMLGSVGGAWAMFEGRISRVEQSYSFSSSRLDRIENKIDRLIEGERGRQ